MRYFTVATAGHVDHGKTSLLKRLTGIDPDRLKEEKERQMTTDLGFVHLTLQETLGVGFIDVPGHGKFLKNMLAGVGGIDLALLVVAADEGPMPQTRQHAKILGLLGVPAALLVVTKVDAVDAGRARQAQSAAAAVLARYGLRDAGCVLVSSLDGSGFDDLKGALATALTAMPERRADGAVFLPVDRVFTKAGFGTVATGTLVDGVLADGGSVFVQPGNLSARVRRLESLGRQVASARPGQRVAVNLVVKDGAAIGRGHVIVETPLPTTDSVLVTLSGWDDPRELAVLEKLAGQPVRLYHGTAEAHGGVRWVARVPAAPGEEDGRIAHVVVEGKLVIEPADRFVIRLTDETIFGGTVLFRERPRWLTRERAVRLAAVMAASPPARALTALVEMAPHRVLPVAHIERLLSRTVRAEALSSALSSGDIVRLGETLAAVSVRESLGESVVAALEESARKAERRADGALRHDKLRAGVASWLDRSSFNALLDQLAAAGTIVREADKIALPASTEGGDLSAPPPDALQIQIASLLGGSLCIEVDEIVRLSGAQPAQVRGALAAMEAAGSASVVGYEFAASSESLDRVHREIGSLWTTNKDISPGLLRERLGISRRYVMALLAHFDDRKITRRLKDGRVLLKPPVA